MNAKFRIKKLLGKNMFKIQNKLSDHSLIAQSCDQHHYLDQYATTLWYDPCLMKQGIRTMHQNPVTMLTH